MENKKWSAWRKWDLQVQTILDDWYDSIDGYFDELKKNNPEKIDLLVTKIWSEELIKKYDSKNYYFTDSSDTKKNKAKNYSKLLLNYIDIFNSDIWAIWVTDHNYYDDYLIDELINESKNTNVKVIPWVEVNIWWIHTLVFFWKIPYWKTTFSEWIKMFLSKLDINNPKDNWALTVSPKSNIELIDIVKEKEVDWIIIYPHCNSSNWLFQDRTRTDRTHLANIYNSQELNILQAQNKTSADTISSYISTKPLLKSGFKFTLCSDSRCLKNIFSSDDNWNYTWIKADTTFEWLRQIIFETERVYIWKYKPADNLNKISKVELNFNENVKINKRGRISDEYDFCFSWVNEVLHLSDYFNCFIWWRWSWKSSLLNLIYKKIENEDTSFFKENELKNFDLDQIKIESSSDKIEFLWQNRIEEFATDYKEFSRAIYQRLENQDELQKDCSSLRKEILDLDNTIKVIQEEEQIDTELKDSLKRLESYNKIIDIIKWAEYQKYQTEINNTQEKLLKIQKSKINYTRLKEWFSLFMKNYSKLEIEESEYDIIYNEIIWKFEDLENYLHTKKFDKEENNEAWVSDNLKNIKAKLSDYLSLQWISQEKLNDLNNAQDWIHDLSLKIPELKKKLESCREVTDALTFTIMDLAYKAYEYQIKTWLNISQEKLKNINNENIWEIKFNVIFDIERAKEDLFNNFMIVFWIYKEPWLRLDLVKNSLFSIDIKNILDWEVNKEQLLSKFWNSWYDVFLKKIFDKDSNFEIYKILIAKYLYNLEEYLIISILYDNRPIESSSFWQRCTVVILIMLLFWTKPIIIDEPEAHLDSSLIADYLVNLIKERKKERQIIFATHNANFVINWDSEQIYILENIDNKTNILQTTIENLNYREKLLKLEWWEKAFKSRWKKLIESN